MILEIVFWLFITLLLISLLLTYIFNMGTTLWEIFVSLINTKTVDLRTKFGEWAGKKKIHKNILYILFFEKEKIIFKNI